MTMDRFLMAGIETGRHSAANFGGCGSISTSRRAARAMRSHNAVGQSQQVLMRSSSLSVEYLRLGGAGFLVITLSAVDL